jgi:CoA transferase family III
MEQLGIDPVEIVAGGTTWVSISAYGRGGHWRRSRNRVGFGDDVAVAAGLVAGSADAPMFCGDAAADPVTGLHAAVAAAASLLADRSHFVDVSMRDAVASTVGCSRQGELLASPTDDGWTVEIGGMTVPVAAPHSRPASGAANPFGADTDTVMAELACR